MFKLKLENPNTNRTHPYKELAVSNVNDTL